MSEAAYDNLVRDKIVFITGGTGTIGRALIERLLPYRPRAIRVFSRDENKQYFMRHHMRDVPNMRFFVGDARDPERLKRAMEDVDIVFHLAALKHVESCEYNPFEAIKTNIVGTQNVIDVALYHNVKRVVFTSTDKAVNPANAMGASKLMAEKLMIAADFYKGRRDTVFSSVRFGNVMGSSGSVVPTFLDRIQSGLPIEVTDAGMTRFIITLADSIELLMASLRLCDGGEVLIRKMPIIRIVDLAEVLLSMHGVPVDDEHLRIVGPRAGEKLYEELVTLEESSRTFDAGDYFLIRPHIGTSNCRETGTPIKVATYTSDSETPMSKEALRELLLAHNLHLPEAKTEGNA